jgi:ATP-binding cassette subfamily B protein
VTALAQESILGIRVSKAFNHESEDKEKFEDANIAYTQAMINVAKGISWFYPTVEFVMTIGTALILYIVGINFSMGTMTLGLLFMFPMFLGRIFRPLQSLANFYTEIQNAITAGERIFQVLDETPKVTSPKKPLKLEGIKGKISFKKVTFGYKPKQPVLHDVSFTIKPGETIALVGYTGGGKTTIGNLLCRFYDPWQGSIEFDDRNLQKLDLDKVQKQIAVVLQEPFLFAGSIRDNIKYGKPDAVDADVWEVLKIVGLKEFVEGLPNSLDTNVQERGIQLSSGQRQLVSFARALIANPPILILDEATSSVDLYTESLIQQALESLLSNRTSVVIAHRLSTIRNASRIFVVDDGKIVDIGTHNELVRRKGIYRDLYKIQFKDNVPDLKVREERAFSKEIKDVKIKAPQRTVPESDMGG